MMKAKNLLAALLFSALLAFGLVGCQQQNASSESSAGSSAESTEAAEASDAAEGEGGSDSADEANGDESANAPEGEDTAAADDSNSDDSTDANGDGNDAEAGDSNGSDSSGENDSDGDQADAASHVYKRTSMVYLDPIIVVDDDKATVVIESTEGFDNGDVGMNVTVTNKTDDMLRIECLEGDFTVGDDTVRLLGTGLFNPGEQDDMFLYVDSRRLSSPAAEAFTGVSGTLSAYNDTTGDLIATYPFAL